MGASVLSAPTHSAPSFVSRLSKAPGWATTRGTSAIMADLRVNPFAGLCHTCRIGNLTSSSAAKVHAPPCWSVLFSQGTLPAPPHPLGWGFSSIYTCMRCCKGSVARVVFYAVACRKRFGCVPAFSPRRRHQPPSLHAHQHVHIRVPRPIVLVAVAVVWNPRGSSLVHGLVVSVGHVHAP